MPKDVRSSMNDEVATTTTHRIEKPISRRTEYAGWLFHFQSARGHC
jgi:hypothetical protein